MFLSKLPLHSHIHMHPTGQPAERAVPPQVTHVTVGTSLQSRLSPGTGAAFTLKVSHVQAYPIPYKQVK